MGSSERDLRVSFVEVKMENFCFYVVLKVFVFIR